MFGNLNENVIRTIEKINHIGNKAYIAGNTVRELLTNEVPAVYILITDAGAKKIKTLFRRVLENREKNSCLTVIENQTVIDIYHKPDFFEGTFEEFLKHILTGFDFTVNSMAYSASEGIIDCFGAMDDFNKKQISFIDISQNAITEKPLRMLKAVRYSAQMGFSLKTDTAQLIKKCSMLIKRVPNDILREELDKILMSPNPISISMLHTLGLMRYILPEADICFSVPQRNKYHIYNVGEHIMQAVANSAEDYTVRWAALLHDTGKPESKSTDSNGIIHFYGHHRQSVRVASVVLRRFKFDAQQTKDILILIENHDVRIDPTPLGVKKMMCRTGQELFTKLILLQEADNRAKNEKFLKEKLNKLGEIKKIYQKIITERQPYRISDLAVNGRDLSRLGFRQGHEIADTLQMLLDEVLVDPGLNTREYLIARAKKYQIKKRSDI